MERLVELVFYCLFPFLCGMLARVRPLSRLLKFAAVFFAIEIVLFVIMAVAVEHKFDQLGRTAQEMSWTIGRLKTFPGLRIWEFLLGCIMGLAFLEARAGTDGWWRALDRRRTRDALLAGSSLGLFALLLLPLVVDLPQRGVLAHLTTVGLYVAYTPFAVLIVTAVAWGPTVINPLLEQRNVLQLGEASYSFYMLQWNALMMAIVLAGGTPGAWPPVTPGWWLSLATIVALAFVSLASERWIETPARRFLRGTPHTRGAVQPAEPRVVDAAKRNITHDTA